MEPTGAAPDVTRRAATVLANPCVLIADPDLIDGHHASALRSTYRLATATDVDGALQALRQHQPDLVIVDTRLGGGNGAEICRAAKSLERPALVLVTTSEAQHAPDVILAGCDGVLLKPFAPNLLYARLGRLMRMRLRAHSARLRTRSGVLLERAETQRSKVQHLIERAERCHTNTLGEWPTTSCPYCRHQGVTSFDYCSLRRAWYACLECRKVWIARRQE